MTAPIRLFWASCGHRNGNAGDEVSADIVRMLSGCEVVQAGPEDADLVAAGSVLHHLPPWFRGAIWGAGAMGVDAAHGDRFVARPFARVCAVRGKLTASRWPGLGEVAFGDPGLLAGDLWPIDRSTTRYVAGVVPHYIDGDCEELRAWVDLHPEVAVLDICQRPRDLLEQMARCRVILSSSLHGLVFADALRIPNVWVRLSDKLAGGDFKFHDYYSAFGLPASPYPFHRQTPLSEMDGIAERYQRPGIEALKDGLRRSFPFPRTP